MSVPNDPKSAKNEIQLFAFDAGNFVSGFGDKFCDLFIAQVSCGFECDAFVFEFDVDRAYGFFGFEFLGDALSAERTDHAVHAYGDFFSKGVEAQGHSDS